MSLRRSPLPMLVAFGLCAARGAGAVTVEVLGTYPTIQAALDDPVVTVIRASPGRYSERLRVQREVTLEAAPSTAPFTSSSCPSVQARHFEHRRFECTETRARNGRDADLHGLARWGGIHHRRFDSALVTPPLYAGALRVRGCLVLGGCLVSGNPLEPTGGLFVGGGVGGTGILVATGTWGRSTRTTYRRARIHRCWPR